MWWERWIPVSYLTKSAVCAVECVFRETDVSYHYAVLGIKKNKIGISQQGVSKDVKEVLAVVKKAVAPVTIAISGKGVIVKKIIFSENDSLQLSDLLKQHLPAIPFNDFYVQFYKNAANSGHIAVCRKEQVNGIIEQFSKHKTEIANLFIGPAICNALSGIISAYNRLGTSTTQLELVNGFVESVQPVNEEESVSLMVDDLTINSAQVIPFAAGFSYLTRQANYVTDNTEVSNLPKNHFEKIKIRLLLFFFVSILFVVSGLNSVLFFQKYEEDNALQVELNLYESKNTQITQLLEEYQKKKSLIEQAGIFEHKKISVYADKIAASLPQDIVLRELYFNPEEGETEEDSLIDFKQNQLIIKGNCSKSLLLNDWVNVLKSQSFVKSVNLENFVFNSEGHLPNFVLKLETE